MSVAATAGCYKVGLEVVDLLTPLPLVKPLLQGLGAVDVLSAGTTEKDQGQLSGGQCVGAGVVAVFDLKVEMFDPVIKPGVAHIDLRA